MANPGTTHLIWAIGLSFPAGVVSAASWAPLEAKSLDQPEPVIARSNVVTWPVLGWQTELRIGDRMAVWDERPIRYITLTGANVALQIPFAALEFWAPNPKSRGRYGYELTFKYDDRAIMGVSVFGRDAFLSSLDDEPWQAYLASLSPLPAAQLITDSDGAQNPNQLRVLDGRTRVLEYRFAGKKQTDPERAVLQIFIENADQPYVVFSLECNAQDLSFVGPAFANLVTSFEIGSD